MPIEPPEMGVALGEPPGDLIQSVINLAGALDGALPAKQLDRNLVIGSWNLREFGGVTQRWVAEAGDKPKRNVGDVWCIAEIASRFDVLAIQEAQNETAGLELLVSILGRDWGIILTDTTSGATGGWERLAFIFDLRRVRPTGLAGELVLSPEDLKAKLDGLDRQFARTPYLVSFTSVRRPFTLATVHVIFGDNLSERSKEASALGDLLAKAMNDPSPDSPDQFRSNLIALGDFNIEKTGDETYTALEQHGLQPDPALADLPRTTGETPGHTTAFDQVAWFVPPKSGALTLPRLGSGTFAWPDHLTPIGPGDPTYRISDHYPLWLELDVARRG
jgi:endonuclease/exonuclease/phosphatase family metal-dependent hydrolase